MLLRISVTLLAVAVASCAKVSPAPQSDAGTTGGTGTGGTGGTGTGGTGGMGGVGGSGGLGGLGGNGGSGGLDPCAVLPNAASDTEANDIVESTVVMGSVSGACVGGSCTGEDPFDRWTFTACDGKHSIELAWDDINRDLDLYLFDQGDVQIGQSATPDTTEETITVVLEAAQPYVVEVQAFDTNGNIQGYRLEIIPIE